MNNEIDQINNIKNEIIKEIHQLKNPELKTKSNRLLEVLFILLFLLSLIAVLLNTLGVFQKGNIEDKSAPIMSGLIGKSKKYIGEILVEGPIGFSLVNYVTDKLKKFEKNPDCVGVILRLNSPGGTVGASQEVYDAIIKFKLSNKPVYASVGDIAASGAYYIASACDKIYANRGSTVGSIGVIMANFNFSGIMKKYDVKFEVVKSGKYKDMFSSFKDIESEELALLKKDVDKIYDQFLNDVLKFRGTKFTKDKLKEYAQGQTFVGEEALTIGLIDELGNYDVCITKMTEELNAGPLEILKEQKTFFDGLKDMFKTSSSLSSSNDPLSFIERFYVNEVSTSPLLLMYPGVNIR